MGKIKDLTGIILESGTKIIKFSEIKNHSAYWECECVCGKHFISRGADLSNGHTTSCGCLGKKHRIENNKNLSYRIKNLINQNFGKLTVLEDTGKRTSDRRIIWKCKCECGNICEVSSASLLKKHPQQSCGCLNSKGEYKINQILIKENLKFITQYTFNDLIFIETNYHAKFDFYLPEQNILIEYDGIQHLDIRYGWNTENNFSKTFQHDKIKNEYCLNHNIPLYRIPYYDLDKINTLNDILQEKYLVKKINHYNIE